MKVVGWWWEALRGGFWRDLFLYIHKRDFPDQQNKRCGYRQRDTHFDMAHKGGLLKYFSFVQPASGGAIAKKAASNAACSPSGGGGPSTTATTSGSAAAKPSSPSSIAVTASSIQSTKSALLVKPSSSVDATAVKPLVLPRTPSGVTPVSKASPSSSVDRASPPKRPSPVDAGSC